MHLGSSSWHTIDQSRVNAFADVTGDHQWVHVDLERAAASSFGGTLAHGYLTLSMLPFMCAEVVRFETPGGVLNYGSNRVRYPSPVLVGSRVRSVVSLGAVIDLPAGLQVVQNHEVEIEGADKPACVAETIVLLTP